MNLGMKYHTLLKSFPNYIKPSYETMLHKKVSAEYDLEIAIPYGKKSFLWFTWFENKPLCCIIEIGRNQQLQDNIHVLKMPYNKELFLGTILSGYIVEHEENPDRKYFLADDIFNYCGYELGNPFPIPLNKKMGIFTEFFLNLKNNVFDNYSIHSIIMWNKQKEAGNIPEKWKNIPYPVKFIQYRNTTNVVPYLNWTASKNVWGGMGPQIMEDEPVVKKDKIWSHKITHVPILQLSLHSDAYKGKKMFWVTADMMYDVYYLYVQKNTLYMHAFIPDMKTSKMMNSIFRNISENDSLDKIEESDDEEEFENIKDNKYVKMIKPVLMECVFNRKFKRWVPLCEKPTHLGKYVQKLEELVHNNNHNSNNNHKNNYNYNKKKVYSKYI